LVLILKDRQKATSRKRCAQAF